MTHFEYAPICRLFKLAGEMKNHPHNFSKIFFSIAMIYYHFNVCYGAIDSNVTVFGTTVGPNFKRAEGNHLHYLTLKTNL